MHKLSFRAMGCEMLAILDGGESLAGVLPSVPGWFAEWEQALSRFRADSELSALNRCAGQWLPVGSTLWAVTQAAIESAHGTQGIVTPLALNAVAAAGYDRSFEQMADSATPATAVAVPDWRELDWDARTCALRLPAGAGLDLGGTAKGWAADEAAKRLAAFGPALVDAGGDIAINGPQAGGEPWPVALDVSGVTLATRPLLMLATGGVATSGRDYRRWLRDGQPQHHIIDPRTGRPAQTDVLTATAVAPSAREAEAAAKVMLILGSDAGRAWIDARPWLAGLMVNDDGRLVGSRRINDFLWEPLS